MREFYAHSYDPVYYRLSEAPPVPTINGMMEPLPPRGPSIDLAKPPSRGQSRTQSRNNRPSSGPRSASARYKGFGA